MKRKPEDMKVILDELKEQCLKTAKLIQNFDPSNKSEDERDEMVGNLSANLAILTVNSGLIESYLDGEEYSSNEPTNKRAKKEDEDIPSFLK